MTLNSKFNYICFYMVLTSFFLLMILSIALYFSKILMMEVELFFFNSINFSFVIFLDWMSIVFSMTVLVISSLIMIYGKEYMGNNCYRFLWLTFLFIVFMLLMICSPSVLSVILGWDGLGLISYCLVIYYQSSDSFNSGFITAASNRFGDSMLILAITWFSMTGMYMYYEMMHDYWSFFLFFSACLTKSAQIPFSAWLPSAMAAPTPISSLVHSSTLVTAGVYMLIRFNSYLYSSNMMVILMVISILTIYLAGISSFFEHDMKRIIALSTLGQLGFMMMILSMGYPIVAFFHLLIHALFKALLFMCAGAVIHSGVGIQDMRKMGNIKIDYILKLSLSVSSFCLMGIPFTSGFYSKDFLLELVSMSAPGVGLGTFMLLAAFVTVAYSIRTLLFLTFQNYWIIWIQSSSKLLIPIFLLTLFNVFGGCYLNWLIMEQITLISLTQSIKIMPIFLICLGCIWQGLLNLNLKNNYFINSMFFISSFTKNLAYSINMFMCNFKTLDQGWMENTLFLWKKSMLKTYFFMKLLTLNFKHLHMMALIITFILFF
uniref:NADH-ubiquinone oxidoreductase chain 5 n=1 Tax=Anoeconeossa unicornuta TaxID=2218011 RepID=A0A344A247_9HEMI|nr:NADH dehydrogenase subunit 5 [Anoeconeossa unicornuta]AWU48838.1 NADH dehydrogenase subunit 5 [Anoeconeossa unicornuta]